MNTRKILSILFLFLAVISALALYRENNPVATPVVQPSPAMPAHP